MNLYSIIKLLSFLVHTVLGLYVLWKRPRHKLNQAFSLAVLSIAVMEFGYFMLLVGSGWILWARIALIGQCLTLGNIVLFSLIYGRENYRDSLKAGKFYLIAIYFVSFFLIIAILSGTWGVEHGGHPRYELTFNRMGYFFTIFLFICALVALINLESTYRQTGQGKKRIKYPAIVFMGMLFFQLLVYSLTLGFSYELMGTLDVLVVASITLMAANICVAYPVIRLETVASGIYISRTVIARSYTLLMAGIYLLIIGMLGKIVQIVGRNLNFFLAFFMAFFVLLALMSIVLSKSLKRRFQSFIGRNFYRNRYDYRLEWEKFSRRVFSTGVSFSTEKLLREVLNTVSDTIGVDSVSIWVLDAGYWILDEGKEHQISSVQHPASSIQNDEFLEWLWRYGSPVMIDNGQCKADGTSIAPPDIPDNLLLMLESGFQYPVSGVCVPIIAERRLIAIMVLGIRETLPYSQEDMELLETMANQISIAIMNARTSQELAVSRELESFYKLSAMLLHDLKSSAAMLSLVIQNAADNFDNPDFQKDALSTMSTVVDRIQRLILKLSTVPPQHTLQEAQPILYPEDMMEIVSNAVSKSGVGNLTTIKLVEEFSPVPRLMVDRENIERVILNLIMNAIEAIEGEGVITVRIYEEKTQDSRPKIQDSYAAVSVSDTGRGMSQEFIRDRLFQPFQTTKERGLGIGLYQCKAIIDACGGFIDVQSRQEMGSTFIVKLPI